MPNSSSSGIANRSSLVRHPGLTGLAATGICSRLGAAINTIAYTVLRSAAVRVPVAGAALLMIGGLLVVHVVKNVNASVDAWYFHSTPIGVIVLVVASLIYLRERAALVKRGVDFPARFATLPPE